MARIDEYVSNPELVEAMRAVKDQDSRVTQNMVIRELLEAKLLIPVTYQAAEDTPLGSREQQAKIQFHMIQNTAKKRYFLAFTSIEELRKWRDQPDQRTAILRFDDYAALVLDAGSGAEGIAIDPLGENLIMKREQVKILRRQKRIKEGGGIDLSAVYEMFQ